MKANVFIPPALFFLVLCTQGSAAPTSPQEQEPANKDLKRAVNAIIQGLEQLDAEALFQVYSNTPDFILFTTDGTMADFQAAKNHHVQWFKSLSSLKVTTVADEFRFFSDDVALCAWRTTFAMKLKTGGEPKVDFAITFVFNKIDNRWKVVYQQTSALPPVQGKTSK